jgi:hypothetical protein
VSLGNALLIRLSLANSYFWTLEQAGSLGSVGRCRLTALELGNGLDQLSAMSEQHTKLLKIGFGEQVQRFEVNPILGQDVQPSPNLKVSPCSFWRAPSGSLPQTGATFRYGGNMAYYALGPDLIQLPLSEALPTEGDISAHPSRYNQRTGHRH